MYFYRDVKLYISGCEILFIMHSFSLYVICQYFISLHTFTATQPQYFFHVCVCVNKSTTHGVYTKLCKYITKETYLSFGAHQLKVKVKTSPQILGLK